MKRIQGGHWRIAWLRNGLWLEGRKSESGMLFLNATPAYGVHINWIKPVRISIDMALKKTKNPPV
jgi:hypothetical protein